MGGCPGRVDHRGSRPQQDLPNHQETSKTADEPGRLELPAGVERIDGGEGHKVALRFSRLETSASRIAAAVMDQIEVLDFSIAEPDLAVIVRQICDGALEVGS